jgi:purine catabolism regulator
MGVPTVASLSGSLGEDLQPVAEGPLPDTAITAVHISELLDPSPYLSGGELLLTLGINLPGSKIGCRRYVTALRRGAVSAVVLGLGPVHASVPQQFAEACAEAGLPLLIVPRRTPFLTVTKAYWSAVAKSSERHLNDAIATHRALVHAAASSDPVAAVLKCLARWVDGWAGVLDVAGKLDQIHPAGFQESAEALEAEVRRLEVAGVHSAASFVAAGSMVVLFPLASKADIVGYLAVGTEHQLDAAERNVVLAACGLLSLDATRARSQLSADAARRQSVALLLDDGEVLAAERLASRFGLAPIGKECRVMTLRGRDAEALDAAVHRWCPASVGAPVDRTTECFVLPALHPDVHELISLLRQSDRTIRGLVSELVRVEEVGSIRIRQLVRLGSLRGGEVTVPSADTDERALGRHLDDLAAAGPTLVDALAAYLRGRGQWEQAARDLGLHRNTVRYRVDRARTILDLDLSNADIAARLWLRMRERGMA